jgi:hypothetical protein
MNICSHFGYNKMVLHTMRAMLHICEICMRKTIGGIMHLLVKKSNQIAWFFAKWTQWGCASKDGPSSMLRIFRPFYIRKSINRIRKFRISFS